ncbi:hypothetical protein LPY66_09870 [Dehalobacter sp. DCM]|uniref:hypothetical protein n=1 Tax=Dehalobacter sp. DCM TaxID=2907827 RepID=UPI003081F0C5|nr:hypothetical protein LPY66_09870 [Dehalobacter sp. DCM]
MGREEYLQLSETEKFKFLNKEAVQGKNFNQILSDLSMTKEDLAREGFYYIGNKFVRKPPLKD